jgi:two-component system LytT family response regulator
MISLPKPEAIRLKALSPPPSIVALWIYGSALLWALYAFVFVGTGRDGVAGAALHALDNVLPISVLAIAVRAMLKAEVMRRSTAVQAAWHAALAVAFAFVWYAMLLVLLAITAWTPSQGLVVTGFSGPALTWQVFQGLILYAAIAAVCYAVRGGREAAQVTMVTTSAAAPPLTRYLIRKGEEMTPVASADIVCILGAQDYAEVATLRDRHLIRMSLGELEARLDPTSFVRVHRSAIINLGRLERTEPAGGGRLLAHMSNGETIQVSRAGAQALRRFLI